MEELDSFPVGIVELANSLGSELHRVILRVRRGLVPLEGHLHDINQRVNTPNLCVIEGHGWTLPSGDVEWRWGAGNSQTARPGGRWPVVSHNASRTSFIGQKRDKCTG